MVVFALCSTLIPVCHSQAQIANRVLNTKTYTLSKQRSVATEPKAPRIDPRLLEAMQIAIQRARKRSVNRCWRFVKKALVAAEVVDSYPTSRYAKEAAVELKAFGFQPINIDDPFEAPVGSILVYGGKGPGHVEFRTQCGFVSDFLSSTPSTRPLIGVYVKMLREDS